MLISINILRSMAVVIIIIKYMYKKLGYLELNFFKIIGCDDEVNIMCHKQEKNMMFVKFRLKYCEKGVDYLINLIYY